MLGEPLLHTTGSKDVTPPKVWQDAPVVRHGQLRAKHNVTPLVWKYELEEYAGNWVKQCNWEHSGGPYGENIALGFSSKQDAVQAWYDEIGRYVMFPAQWSASKIYCPQSSCGM